MEIPVGARMCPRCGGKGTNVSLKPGPSQIPCSMCHGWRYIAERKPRPPSDEDHLIAMHCGHRDFEEVIKLLPMRELPEDWENV